MANDPQDLAPDEPAAPATPAAAEPVVSVIVAAWRASATLQRAVESAFDASSPETEVIIVDDCSPDDTRAVADRLSASDPRIRVYTMPQNAGPSAVRNHAIEHARGTWIAVLDADDAFTPGRLGRLVAFGEEHAADIVFDNLKIYREGDAAPSQETFLTEDRFNQQQCWTLSDFIAGNIDAASPSLGYLKPLIRRRFLNKKKIRYNEGLRNCEDTQLIFECLASGGQLWFHPEPGYLYTVAHGSISHRVRPDDLEALIEAEDQFAVRHGRTLSATERNLLERRRRSILDLFVTERALGALKQGHVAAATRTIARH